MYPPRSRITSSIIACVALSAVSIGTIATAGRETGAIPVDGRVGGPPVSTDAPTSTRPTQSPQATLYDSQAYAEDTLLDEWTGVGPFNVDYPCGALSVDEAADVVPGVIGASVDGGSCYYYTRNDAAAPGDVHFEDAFAVDPDNIPSAPDAGDWFFEQQQDFYTDIYGDATPPAGEECEPVEGLGDRAVWCFAPGEQPTTLLIGTTHLGIRITAWEPIARTADEDEHRERDIFIDIADRILDNAGLVTTD